MYRLAPNPWIGTGWGRGARQRPLRKGDCLVPRTSHFEPSLGWAASTATVLSDYINRTRVDETREVTLARPPLMWLPRSERDATKKSQPAGRCQPVTC